MKKVYYSIKHKYDLIKKNNKFKVPLSFTKKMLYLHRGFLSEKYYLYELYKNDYHLYLSDYQSLQAKWINDPFTEILTNKYIFSHVFKNYVKVPLCYGLILNGTYYSEDEKFKNLLDLQKFVLKPVTGGGGKGVFLVEIIKGKIILNNKDNINNENFNNIVKSLNNYLVCEFIEQSSFSKSLNPDSINSMRVLTMVDPLSNEPFIARASQRIGVKNSAPQDNFSKGGLSAKINLETGELSDATTHPFTNKHIRYDHHPETGIKIKGQVIPQWQTVKQQIFEFIKKIPMIKIAGWDILLTENGICIIEGNHHPDPDVLQCHEPLFVDERIKNFYKYYKILK